jgi:hypothetical protein
MSQVVGGLTNGVFIYNQLTFAEVVVETSGVGATGRNGRHADQHHSARRREHVLRRHELQLCGPKLESDNLSDALIARKSASGAGRRV